MSISDRVFNQVLSKQMVFTEDSLIATELNKPHPINFNLYVWNCTNYEAVDFGAKPKFEEVGPYVYSLDSRNLNTTFDHENHSVKFQRQIFIYYNQAATHRIAEEKFREKYPEKISMDGLIYPSPHADMIYHANIPAITYAKIKETYKDNIENLGFMADMALKAVESQFSDDLYVLTNNTVGGLLEGYDNSMMSMLKAVINPLIDMLGDTPEQKEIMKRQIDSTIPDNLGIFTFINGTITPFVEVDDGTEDIRNVMKIKSTDGKTSNDCWKYENLTDIADHFIDSNYKMTHFNTPELFASDGIFYPPLTSYEQPPEKIRVYRAAHDKR